MTPSVSILLSLLLDAATRQKSRNRCACEFDQGGEKKDQNIGNKEQGGREAQSLNTLSYCRVFKMKCNMHESMKVCAH